MVGSLSCSSCQIFWPLNLDLYRNCPGCNGRTWHSWKKPTDPGEANRLAFDRFYELREAEIAKRVDECMVDVELEQPVADA